MVDSSLIVAGISVVVTALGVYYSSKSYMVAEKIFDKGIQLDKDKILHKLSLEFVNDFFIPLSKFLIKNDYIIESTVEYECIPILLVQGNLTNSIDATFPYFYANKGDIWEAVFEGDEKEQAKEFVEILEFVEDAERFKRLIEDLRKDICKYIEENKNNVSKTLQDYLKESHKEEKLRTGIELAKKFLNYEKELPPKLDIEGMKSRLNK